MMFENSLLDSPGTLNATRGWATGMSAVSQGLLIGIVLLTPLIYTQELPRHSQITLLAAPHAPSAPPPPQAAAPVKIAEVSRTGIVSGPLRTPKKIPQRIEMVKEDSSPPPLASTPGGIG